MQYLVLKSWVVQLNFENGLSGNGCDLITYGFVPIDPQAYVSPSVPRSLQEIYLQVEEQNF